MYFSQQTKLNAILEYQSGVPISKVMAKYQIKGTATLYEWIRKMNQFGISGLSRPKVKTQIDYSFKLKVLNWRFETKSSFPETAKQFRIRTPTQIYQWERDLLSGRLRPNKGSIVKMKDKPDKTKKELQDEIDYLRARVAYLEKLDALIQKKKKFQTSKKPN
ncbi:helix-turn-helix domain-containing protein [Periweissella beninensis]|uniref:Helix-turn-helix domain-containing protein n=1 Tax=Periweissella beninensis TaxID=504936 RepID=A0ABT0VEZ1_9LACO|nr:helix-turn-helix domain-containing protein [Periweissella beninensis]MBM7545118.1 transposase-like protein [Periweissella beninensis]MCM2436427.1 helix-turn-helix domain-containing protein [Periweissella beninensis]MCT4397053.1 helix-turn-helix domain-containing protein [Periweissella beninensis]